MYLFTYLKFNIEGHIRFIALTRLIENKYLLLENSIIILVNIFEYKWWLKKCLNICILRLTEAELEHRFATTEIKC